MTNWVYQEVHYRNEKDFEKLKNLCMGKDENFDLNKIVPMPETIDYTTSPTDITPIGFYIAPKIHDTYANLRKRVKKCANEIKNPLKTELTNDELESLVRLRLAQNAHKKALKNVNNNERFQEYCKIKGIEPNVENYGKLLLTNYLAYGTIDWYDWSIRYWGTKWNTRDTLWNDTSVYFNTPSRSPKEALIEASKILNIPLFIEWSTDQLNEDGGYLIINDGCIKYEEDYEPDSKEMFIVAARLYDPDQAFIKFDEDTNHMIYDWEFDDEAYIKRQTNYESFEDIPTIKLNNQDLEDFLDEYR